MSILQVNNLCYIHGDRTPLFTGVSFSLPEREKIAVVGPNGCGKSTLLSIIAGRNTPSSGAVVPAGNVYYIPQHFGQYGDKTIAGALGIEGKITALRSIVAGDPSAGNYEILGDDWDIEERALAALEKWGLHGFTLSQPLYSLSGGEKTRVFLSGIDVHQPDLVLMDEPSNHLDAASREKLYEFIRSARTAMLIVSHDRTLLNLLDRILELGTDGVTSYGGNYEFYKEQKEIALAAMQERVADREKSLRSAQKVAREATQRKEKTDARGKGKMKKEGVPRIMLKKITDGAAASARKLKEVHSEKIGEINEELNSLRGKLPDESRIKIKLDDSALHTGKTLVKAEAVNFSYGDKPLWDQPLSFIIRSGQRIVLAGGNGSGKTTLIKLILGSLEPTQGKIIRADNLNYLYIDQEYSLIDDSLSISQQVQRYNARKLPEHIVNTELTRFLFPFETWDKLCGRLSGGEKMRLIFCCLMVKNAMPDIFILDEPTNNLDIRSLEIVTKALKSYRGTLLVVSHDRYFTREIDANEVFSLP